jgi:hypothetical protein
MRIKNRFLLLLSLVSIACAAETIRPQSQTLQINTQFRSFVGKPQWVLIVRDVQTQEVFPYLFEIKNNDNFWVAFTPGRSYRVTASSLKFGPYAKVRNFCRLENGILDGTSMIITLTGTLTPSSADYKCRVMKYNNVPFTIVNH